ncbi:MAG TPA: hypothetical protein VM490_22905 [Armatimonadaceae bacterium]|nr:hypothetical protein [Armatimonadaceae bacterium]
MSAPKKISDSDLEGLFRAARPGEPAPLDPDRARAIFERAIALSSAKAADPSPAATLSWWGRLRAALLSATPLASPPARLAWGGGVAFAAVILLVSVAVTGSNRTGSGGRTTASTNPLPAAKGSGTPLPSPPANLDAARVAAAARREVATGDLAVAPAPPRPTQQAEKSAGRRAPQRRSGRIERVASSGVKSGRKAGKKVPAATGTATADYLPVLDEEPPVLMVASNLPQGRTPSDSSLASGRTSPPIFRATPRRRHCAKCPRVPPDLRGCPASKVPPRRNGPTRRKPG